ncbi:phospholipase A2 [Centroberyx gerrardi]|uniref:phospholipase A2 n=1 Tax=Centroberyx gerrardi TaxID=166262 RepID=UPI003AAA6716
MNPSRILLVLAVCLPALLASPMTSRGLWQLRGMILCNMPHSWPVVDFADYGCYCGKGGSGTPVDDLDRCCQTHDQCYTDAMQDKNCLPIIDNPYTYSYSYHCDKTTHTATCLSDNNACEMFICECDRKAALCFSKAGYIKAHDHYPSHLCHQS